MQSWITLGIQLKNESNSVFLLTQKNIAVSFTFTFLLNYNLVLFDPR